MQSNRQYWPKYVPRFQNHRQKSMQTDCCYFTCHGHHILTGNSSSMFSFVSVSTEAKPEGGRKQHRRTMQNKSIGNTTNKTQEKKEEKREKGLKKNEIHLKKIWQRIKHRFLPSSKTQQIFSSAFAKMHFPSQQIAWPTFELPSYMSF